MNIPTKRFRVDEDDKVDLKKRPTRVAPFYKSKDQAAELMALQKERLAAQQDALYAHNRHALLLIFQAMDAAGKDGAIKHVMSGINPAGCQAYSFKQPSAEELEHDFLWRTTRCLPERGRIGIFNRSYYEEVLVVRVHPEFLGAQNLPAETKIDGGFWEQRYRSITDFEKHLHRNGTRVIKFFLHLSKAEQRKRFLSRIDDPAKNWKFSEGDLAERARWKDYMKAYASCLSATSTRHSPWYVVPADDKRNARLIIAEVIGDALEDLKLRYPEPTPARRAALKALRSKLTRSG